MLLLAAVSVILFVAGNSYSNLWFFIILIFFIFSVYIVIPVLIKLIQDIIHSLEYFKKIYFNIFYFFEKKLNIDLLSKDLWFLIVIPILVVTYTPFLYLISDSNFIFSLIINFFGYGLINIPFSSKIVFFGFLFILVRANVPRYRFDQLLSISWKALVPVAIASLINSFIILFIFNGFITIL
jgi:hypothetical protein